MRLAGVCAMRWKLPQRISVVETKQLSPVEKTNLLRTFVVPPPPQEIAEQLEGLHNGVYFGWAKLQGEQVACHPGWTLLLSSPCCPIDPSARADEAR